MLLFGLRPIFSASKNREFRSAYVDAGEALALFLQNNNLCNRLFLREGEKPDVSFEIHFEDLNELVQEVIDRARIKWENGISRGKDPRDVSVFQRELDRIRRQSS